MKVLRKRSHLIGHSIKILSAHRRPQIHYAEERVSSCYASLIFVAKFVVVDVVLLFPSSQETFSSRDTGMKQGVNQLFSRLKSGTLV